MNKTWILIVRLMSFMLMFALSTSFAVVLDEATKISKKNKDSSFEIDYTFDSDGNIPENPLSLEEAKKIFDKIKNYSFTIGYKFGYDDNISLFPESSPEKNTDTYQSLFGKFRWQKFLGQGWDVKWFSHLFVSKYDDFDDYDQFWQRHTINFGWAGEKWSFRFPITYINSNYDNEHFSETYEITPTAIKQLRADLSLQTYYQYSNRKYRLDDAGSENDFNGVSSSAGISLYWQVIPKKLGLEFGFDYGRIDTVGSNWDNSFYNIYSNVTYQIKPKLQLDFGFGYKKSRYKNINATLDLKRRSNIKSASVGLTYHTTSDYELALNILHQISDANVDVYAYDSTLYTLSVAKHF